jgi:transcriptional regulator with XRE-family HTH domain
MTQAQLAVRAGLSLGTLRNWEQGRREPLWSAGVNLARALGVRLARLAGLDEVPATVKRRKSATVRKKGPPSS